MLAAAYFKAVSTKDLLWKQTKVTGALDLAELMLAYRKADMKVFLDC